MSQLWRRARVRVTARPRACPTPAQIISTGRKEAGGSTSIDCRFSLGVSNIGGFLSAPGAEGIYADASSSDSYERESSKLKNLTGVEVSKVTLQRRSVRIGQEAQESKREDAEAQRPGQKHETNPSTTPALDFLPSTEYNVNKLVDDAV